MIVATTPAPTPRTRYQPLSSGCGSVSCPGTRNRGRHPTKNPLIAYATTDASIARSSAPDSNSMSAYRTSMAKSAAPTGDRKIAAMPAAIPTRRSRRRSAPVRPIALAYHDPSPAASTIKRCWRPSRMMPEPRVLRTARWRTLRLIREEKPRLHVGCLHGADQAIHYPADPANLDDRHFRERVQQTTLGRVGGVGRDGRPPLGQHHAHHAPVGALSDTAHQSPFLQSVEQDGNAALVHGQGCGQLPHRQGPTLSQRLERPELRTGERVGSEDFLRIGVERLHDAPQPLHDLRRVSARRPCPRRPRHAAAP